MVSFVRSIGRGLSALLNFCQHTNSPPPISETSYQSVMHTIGLASKKVAEESMEKAAREVGISNEEGITDCGVSVDGTWQPRGHSSHHGVVTAISIETVEVTLVLSTLSKHQQTFQMYLINYWVR
ncbi:uncharacterized protein LOC129924198 isoform X2 [Biomphalaria glabrata]|uniref:Uncharacterized protein LOC129924198 isoform X2 n=1 Tax=Biomphalaria glabrata TaxID=6526 RepID=A0A9W2ZG61_BIOGL|nr:uncharacterized protein LOC129924198 isoform X2 [Biomphalaria glabrata]